MELRIVETNGSGVKAESTEREPLILVCVISSNEAMAEACREPLERLCPAGYIVEQCRTSDVSLGADIYILDFDSCPSLPPVITTRNQASKLVIANQASLPSIRRKLPHDDLTFLQSPVTPLSLRVAFESAIIRLQLRDDKAAKPPRLSLDRDVILQKLLETNLRLNECNADHREFLARAIHDIRGPLMVVGGYCDLLLAGQAGSIHPEQARILGRVQRSLNRLRTIAEAALDLGANSQPSTKLKLENASLEACMQQALHEVLLFAEEKQISLNVEMEPPSPPLLLDPGQIERVFVNLLDNGCKFTPKGGSITIRGRSITAMELRTRGSLDAADSYRIDISDTGPGIRPEHIEQIFDEHTSYGNPMDRSGSGLGLAICRTIVQAHNGQIWASSNDQGATFSLVLPVARSCKNSQVSQLTT